MWVTISTLHKKKPKCMVMLVAKKRQNRQTAKKKLSKDETSPTAPSYAYVCSYVCAYIHISSFLYIISVLMKQLFTCNNEFMALSPFQVCICEFSEYIYCMWWI